MVYLAARCQAANLASAFAEVLGNKAWDSMFTYHAVPAELDMAPQSPQVCYVIRCHVVLVFSGLSSLLEYDPSEMSMFVGWDVMIYIPWRSREFLDTSFRRCPFRQLDNCRCLDSFCCSFSLRVVWVWRLQYLASFFKRKAEKFAMELYIFLLSLLGIIQCSHPIKKKW